MGEQTPEILTQPLAPAQPEPAPVLNIKKFIFKIIAVSLINISVFFGGIVLGIQVGKKQAPIPQPTSIPTVIPASPDASQGGPTPDETADWETYTSSEYKFSLKYPDSWDLIADAVLQNNSSEGVVFEVRMPNTRMDHGLLDGGSFLVDLIKPYGNLTLKQIVEERTKYYKSARVTSYVLSDMTGFLVEIDSNQESGQTWPSREIYFEKGNWIYNIVYQTNKGQEAFSVFDQILSTFKFLD